MYVTSSDYSSVVQIQVHQIQAFIHLTEYLLGVTGILGAGMQWWEQM